MTNRDELAAVIRPSLQQSDDEGWTVDTLAQALEIADDYPRGRRMDSEGKE